MFSLTSLLIKDSFVKDVLGSLLTHISTVEGRLKPVQIKFEVSMADLDSYFYISLPRADFGICGGKMVGSCFPTLLMNPLNHPSFLSKDIFPKTQLKLFLLLII